MCPTFAPSVPHTKILIRQSSTSLAMATSLAIEPINFQSQSSPQFYECSEYNCRKGTFMSKRSATKKLGNENQALRFFREQMKISQLEAARGAKKARRKKGVFKKDPHGCEGSSLF